MKQFKRNQKGFTLVEIAIVLVIIGLLLGGVLKGQEMIESARIKSVVGDLNGVSAAYNTYVDRFRAIPGDEAPATLAARGWGAIPGGTANGVLAITLPQTFTNAGEQVVLWRSLRAAGMTAGDSTATGVAGLPRAATGGLIGVTVAAYGMPGTSVCVSALTTKQVSGIDTNIDGTLPATNIGNNLGTLRAESNATNPLAPTAAAPAGLAYNETTTVTPWTACRPI